MTMEEVPRPVFGQAHRNAFIDQRGVSQIFRAAPVKQFRPAAIA